MLSTKAKTDVHIPGSNASNETRQHLFPVPRERKFEMKIFCTRAIPEEWLVVSIANMRAFQRLKGYCENPRVVLIVQLNDGSTRKIK